MRWGLRHAAGFAVVGGGVGGCAWYLSNHMPPPVDGALQPGKSLACSLIEVEQLTRDTSRFRFALPTSEHVLGLRTASHIVAVNNASNFRAYTPITLDRFERGFFDLVVKLYPGGTISGAMHKMKLGDKMDFRGPITTMEYAPNLVARLTMVAGGTGITPMYQIIRTVLADPSDKTQMKLLYASRSVGEILLRRELDQLSAAHPEQLQVQYLVEDGGGADSNSVGDPGGVAVGMVDASAVQKFVPPPKTQGAAVLVCGPPGMMQYLCGPPPPRDSPPKLGGLLKKMGYGRQVLRFD